MPRPHTYIMSINGEGVATAYTRIARRGRNDIYHVSFVTATPGMRRIPPARAHYLRAQDLTTHPQPRGTAQWALIYRRGTTAHRLHKKGKKK